VKKSINAKSCAQLPLALPQVLTKSGPRRIKTTPKTGVSGVRGFFPWDGEAPAEPKNCQATESRDSAGASPSRNRIPRLGGSLALPTGTTQHQFDDRPQHNTPLAPAKGSPLDASASGVFRGENTSSHHALDSALSPFFMRSIPCSAVPPNPNRYCR